VAHVQGEFGNPKRRGTSVLEAAMRELVNIHLAEKT
jgi:hypothetical protein